MFLCNLIFLENYLPKKLEMRASSFLNINLFKTGKNKCPDQMAALLIKFSKWEEPV